MQIKETILPFFSMKLGEILKPGLVCGDDGKFCATNQGCYVIHSLDDPAQRKVQFSYSMLLTCLEF